MVEGELAVALRELADGAAFWRDRTTWPADFHNADYGRWSGENPHGDFGMAWWQPFLKTLQAWRAIRPYSGEQLSERFAAVIPALHDAWLSACEPRLTRDITDVTWEQVEPFPRVVATIKPTRSPVFTSKFCHFLQPMVFPVVDNQAIGNAWPTYEKYFRVVQREWAITGSPVRDALVAQLTEMITAAGRQVVNGFPMVNKIVELRLIGRRHPGAG